MGLQKKEQRGQAGAAAFCNNVNKIYIKTKGQQKRISELMDFGGFPWFCLWYTDENEFA